MNSVNEIDATIRASAAPFKALALAHGFALAGIAAVPEDGAAPRALELGAWLQQGLHGPLEYMPATADRRVNIRTRFDWARALLCVALFYDGQPGGESGKDLSAHIARYARGRDYHRIFERRLKRLSAALIDAGLCTKAHYYVDTGPVLERAWAEAAGLGWTGKNTCLIHPRLGSFMLLAELVLDVEIEPDAPAVPHCGTCRRCMDACPTNALPAPGVLDASRCLVTWNIESGGRTPREFWEPQERWAAGCDICQEVCPFNAPQTHRAGRCGTGCAAAVAERCLWRDCASPCNCRTSTRPFEAARCAAWDLKACVWVRSPPPGMSGSEDCRPALLAAAGENDPGDRGARARGRWSAVGAAHGDGVGAELEVIYKE